MLLSITCMEEERRNISENHTKNSRHACAQDRHLKVTTVARNHDLPYKDGKVKIQTQF